MIDIKLIRENPELVKENIRKKFQDHKLVLVDEVLEYDKQLKELSSKAQSLRAERNKLSEQVNKLKKEGKDASEQLAQVKDIPNKIKEIEDQAAIFEEKIKKNMLAIPNIIHPSVPIGKDSTENVEKERIGTPKEHDFEIVNHAQLAEDLGVVDFDTSAKTSGNGFYYLKGDLALLNQALIAFAREYMVKQGYEYIEPPLMIRGEVLNGVYSSSEIDAMAYKIEGEDLYLIATSEHPLIGMFIGKTLKKEDLPIRITGFSPCFRKEIGSHGIDEKGLYRTHQFNKQEMVVVCAPEDSYKFYEEMNNHSKEIFRQLEIPIRELECCSGDLADLKAKSADLEAWSPRKKEYFEITSVTNMEEAQARRLNIKYVDENGNKRFVHTLNNTVIATSRAMVAILENNQNADGSVNIPKVFQPYMFGKKKIEKKK